jgi:hypothetical protein
MILKAQSVLKMKKGRGRKRGREGGRGGERGSERI